MRIALIVVLLAVGLSACGKVGIGGSISHTFGNWAEVAMPDGCKPKQIAAEEGNGVVVLCEDGRIFH